jgi:hypothetical protein
MTRSNPTRNWSAAPPWRLIRRSLDAFGDSMRCSKCGERRRQSTAQCPLIALQLWIGYSGEQSCRTMRRWPGVAPRTFPELFSFVSLFQGNRFR